jgi:hypothetical protein
MAFLASVQSDVNDVVGRNDCKPVAASDARIVPVSNERGRVTEIPYYKVAPQSKRMGTR